MKHCKWIALLAAALLFSGCGQAAQSGSGTSSTSQSISVAASAESSMQQTVSESSAEPTSEQAQSDLSRDDALAIALDYAGVSSDQAYNIKIERDGDNGIPIYDIEFETDYGDYDFEIAISDGKIVGADYEVDEQWVRRQEAHPISIDQAKELVQSKIPDAPLEDIQIREESDDGEKRYEGRLQYDSMVYEFEIDPDTGVILDWNADLRI